MGSFSFWRAWLVAVSWAFVVFGLALAFFNQTTLFNALFNDRVNPAFWPGSAIPPEARTFQQWVYGVLGAVLAGWSIFMAFLAQHALPLKQLWAWRCFVLGIVVWFLVDTSLSVYFGVGFNVLFNVLVLLAVGVPPGVVRKEFNA